MANLKLELKSEKEKERGLEIRSGQFIIQGASVGVEMKGLTFHSFLPGTLNPKIYTYIL